MSHPKPIVRVFADIIQTVSGEILAQIQAAELLQRQVTQPEATQSNIVCINYQFGHLKELVATMKEYEADPESMNKKYPLIALLLDFPEQKGLKSGFPGEVNLQMVIAYSTEPTLKAADRYTVNFEPILLPIYYELLEQIAASPAFVCYGAKSISHTKYDRPYWGKSGLSDTQGNVFADYIDAIEIANLKLTQNFNC